MPGYGRDPWATALSRKAWGRPCHGRTHDRHTWLLARRQSRRMTQLGGPRAIKTHHRFSACKWHPSCLSVSRFFCWGQRDGPFGPDGEVFNSDTAIDIQYFYLDKTHKYLY